MTSLVAPGILILAELMHSTKTYLKLRGNQHCIFTETSSEKNRISVAREIPCKMAQLATDAVGTLPTRASYPTSASLILSAELEANCSSFQAPLTPAIIPPYHPRIGAGQCTPHIHAFACTRIRSAR